MPVSAIDSLSPAIAAAGGRVAFDLVHMWTAMGLFARAVAGVLAFMGVYSAGILAERLVTYRRAARASRAYAERLRILLPEGRYREAIELSRTLPPGYLCKVLGLAVEEYARGGEARAVARDDRGLDVLGAVNRAIERSSLRAVADLRRGLGALATIGSTAPFMGLLGTVAGIITAFDALAATGSGGLGSVSAGIAEALVTTAFGLLVAIPSVMAFNHLTSRVEEIEVDIAESSAELVDFLLKQGRAA